MKPDQSREEPKQREEIRDWRTEEKEKEKEARISQFKNRYMVFNTIEGNIILKFFRHFLLPWFYQWALWSRWQQRCTYWQVPSAPPVPSQTSPSSECTHPLCCWASAAQYQRENQILVYSVQDHNTENWQIISYRVCLCLTSTSDSFLNTSTFSCISFRSKSFDDVS